MLNGLFASPSLLRRLWHTDRERLLAELLLLFLPLGLVVAPEPIWADLFFLFLLPLSLWLAWRSRGAIRLRALPPHLWAATALIGWFVLSLAWDATSQARPRALLVWLLCGVSTLVFVHALAACARQAEFRERLTRALVLFAPINAAIAIARLPFHWSRWVSDVIRMEGWAETRAPILGAAIMSVLLLLALSRAARRGGAWRWGPIGLMAAFVLLTGSRGPALALALALLVLLGWGHPRLLGLLLAAGALGLLAGLALDQPLLSHLWQTQMQRGDSHRFAIWAESWQAILRSPWIGHGPGFRFDDPAESFPHNLLLSTWLYTGVVGVALLAAYFALVLRECGRLPTRPERALGVALVVLVLGCGATDIAQVIKGPGPLWYVIWLPTLLAAARPRKA